MKFTLTYDGDLPSAGNGSRKRQHKWGMRKHFHPQLEELWRAHPALRQVARSSEVPRSGMFLVQQTHHSDTSPVKPIARAGPVKSKLMDLCEPISRGGRLFRPLVRNSYALTCNLNILFLRRELAGRVYQGGDLDNRIKTLLDSLAIPVNEDHVFPDADIAEPILCMLEDDALVTGMTVRTERLLGPPYDSQSSVRLVIEVDVRVADSRVYNQPFLGD